MDTEEQYFNRLRKDNMESFYSNNLNLWIIQNSEYTEFNDKPLTGMKKEIRAVTNYLGYRNDNIATSKNDISGFEIEKPEFIEYEKDKILSLLSNSTNSQLKRKLKHYLNFIKGKELHLQTSQPNQIEEKQEPQKTRKYTAKEYALTYILTLYAKGGSIPKNRVEGGYAKKEIEQVGELKYKLKGNTFYKAVYNLKDYDLIKKTDLENISKDWYNAIMQISNNDKDLKEFLIKKQLI